MPASDWGQRRAFSQSKRGRFLGHHGLPRVADGSFAFGLFSESYPLSSGHTMSAGDSSALDWKVMLSTFGLIFLAELGDKTQFSI